ncbi:M20/M25/M40 family metallo-hydrolase [Reyranella soli]|uniref:Peptidase n=1 Tax=Reyranella soli TaxID=1230389 RepID=A0A512NT11_9HYPH|nr:M20/M25/M40 family metallo-hydrolase [Reyranella soli]GEP62061.1 peptidase [Reyranella soli]
MSKNLRQALARDVEAARDALIATTQRLVAVASPNPPSDTQEVAAVAEALLREIPGMEVERIEPEPRVASLIGRLRGARPGRRLIFNGHLDTFPLLEQLPWTVPPLGGVLRDGKLYGRGVCDMKGGMACSLLAASLLARHRDAWSGEIVLTLAGDEENMGSLGTGYMMKHVPHALGNANICGDVGSPRVVRFGEKGLMWVEVEATGSPAHGAHVHRGTNAIDRLRTALDRLKDLEEIPFQAPPVVSEAIARAKPISEPLSGAGEADTLQRVTVNIGTIEGGTSPNLVPTHAIAHADIRLPVGITTDVLVARLDEWLAPLEGVSWRAIRRFEPSFTPPGHEIVQRTARVAAEVLGETPAVNMRVGGSDSRWYRQYDVPTVVLGLTPFNMGGADEYVLVDELVAVAKIHTLVAYDFLSAEQ